MGIVIGPVSVWFVVLHSIIDGIVSAEKESSKGRF